MRLLSRFLLLLVGAVALAGADRSAGVKYAVARPAEVVRALLRQF